MEFLLALLGLMMVNIVLSGDNAVVIAMACRNLPCKQQRQAILWGSGGAIILRIILTIVAVKLLEIPYLQFAGGALLVWIAAKLLLEKDNEEEVAASNSFWGAVKTIIVADLIMSLDNTLAIAAVANGDMLLLILGLALSIPLIICGSQILVYFMDRFPFIVYIGAGLIAWTAGEMMIRDGQLGHFITGAVPVWLLPAVITVVVVGLGVWKNYRKAPQEVEAPVVEKHQTSDNGNG